MVDSADFANIDLARVELQQLLSSPSLVLGNKNDLENSLTEAQLIEQMQLKKIEKRKIAVYSISAKRRVNIDIALKWISEIPKIKH